MDFDFDATIRCDGTVSLEPANAEDYERVREHLLAFAREMGDGIVVETECIAEDEREAIAQRLAALLLRGVP
jgi:hypothetical protein